MSHKSLSLIAFVMWLLAGPVFAQTATAPTAKTAPAPTSSVTPDQARRALETLQDDAKRTQLIDTLRTIANTPQSQAPQSQPAPPAETPDGPVFVAERSATADVGVVTVLELSDGSGSPVGLVSVAVFAIVPVKLDGIEYVAVIETSAPLAMSPSGHGKPPVHGALAETNASPAGVGSASETALAVLGPLLCTAIV